MSYRLLLDENVERAVAERLRDAGHDVERVAAVPELGTGSDDEHVAAHARDRDRVLLTYDDDFVPAIDGTPTLYVPDETLASDAVAGIVTTIAAHYPQSEIDGVVYAGSNWL
ncbi:DUF5615 family PIN-like protein [Halosimplex pelagicum]|uniref:DUF5615 family PIN-like protein n=1 Tax=Halosimplex pelagicum TaxID=869886 RepID=A0A7D5PER5_9EURY|nr:DUF5615 family PIN-like protein [Halosimplex pelagicum]QLH81919.1 DUF5615 family PIN-like protein [Halosimplex pelagicum]